MSGFSNAERLVLYTHLRSFESDFDKSQSQIRAIAAAWSGVVVGAVALIVTNEFTLPSTTLDVHVRAENLAILRTVVCIIGSAGFYAFWFIDQRIYQPAPFGVCLRAFCRMQESGVAPDPFEHVHGQSRCDQRAGVVLSNAVRYFPGNLGFTRRRPERNGEFGRGGADLRSLSGRDVRTLPERVLAVASRPDNRDLRIAGRRFCASDAIAEGCPGL